MKAKVNKETCIGCGVCVETCPEVFTLNDSDVALVATGRVPVEAKDKCLEASANCPVDAITLEE